MLPSIADAIRYLQGRGFRRTARELLQTYVFARQLMYVTYHDLSTLARIPFDTTAFEVRLTRPDDPLAEAFPRLRQATIARWRQPGHLLYVTLHEGMLAGYRCVTTRAARSVAAFFRLRVDQAFGTLIYTSPAFRRHGVSRITRLGSARDLVARGYRGVFGTQAPTNHGAIVASDRSPILRLGTLSRACTLGRLRFSMTPATRLAPQVVGRQLALLKQVAPLVSHVGLLFNPSVVMTSPETEQAIQRSAAELDSGVTFLPARAMTQQVRAFEEIFATARAAGIDGLIVASDPMMKDHRRTIVSLGERHRLPTVFDAEEFVRAGGLVSYGAPASCHRDIESLNAFVETVTTRGLPAPDPDACRLVVNGRAARAFGLQIPSAQPPTTAR